MIIQEGTLRQTRLLQTKKAKLSTIRCNEGTIESIINCSFFTSSYVVGRDQGDERNDTHPDRDNGKFCDVVIFNDGTYKAGKFNSWDYQENVVAGFSAAAFLVQDGKNCEIYSEGIDNAKAIVNTKNHRTAFAILADGSCLQVVDTNATGFEVRDKLERDYDLELLAILDGGGSTEMIVGGVIANDLKDGAERPMWNGLAFIGSQQEMILRYPCIEGWDSQCFHSKHKALDFGWCSAKGDGHTEIQACADGVVEYEGFYEQKFSDGKTYKPIGVIIRHNQFSKDYDYISIYWHLASTCVDKGQVIKEGQKIGIKGNTGYSGGIHLHFQLLKIAKGAAVPDQHNPGKADNWAKYSINPTDLLRVHSDQYFQYEKHKYAFNLKPYSADEELSNVKEQYELMKYAYNMLKEANEELRFDLETALEDKEAVEKQLRDEKSKSELLTDKLNRINEILAEQKKIL